MIDREANCDCRAPITIMVTVMDFILTLATAFSYTPVGQLWTLLWLTCDFSERNSFNLHDIKMTTEWIEVAFLVV